MVTLRRMLQCISGKVRPDALYDLVNGDADIIAHAQRYEANLEFEYLLDLLKKYGDR